MREAKRAPQRAKWQPLTPVLPVPDDVRVIDHLTDTDLRSRVIAKLAAGKLPLEHAKQAWGGPSQGQRCSACDERIAAAEAELEAAAADGITRYFHPRCYHLLERERDMLGRPPAP